MNQADNLILKIMNIDREAICDTHGNVEISAISEKCVCFTKNWLRYRNPISRHHYSLAAVDLLQRDDRSSGETHSFQKTV